MKKLNAGPLTAAYENGFLRRIRYGETEVLRMIYFALRDHNWNTFTSRIEDETIRISDGQFEIKYICYHVDQGVSLMKWQAKIEGKQDGTIVFEIHGTALEDFRKNRAGFCVLHPPDIAGETCLIIHPDSSESQHPFPAAVAPENPFKQIRAMQWQTAGAPFHILFEGDVFETEDQRNWSDASFKTFCTPLDIPFPVELRRGEKVFQRIFFKPLVSLPPSKTDSSFISLKVSGIRLQLPLLGIAASTEVAELPLAAVTKLEKLKLNHYRTDVIPSEPDWIRDFSKACENAFALKLPLEVALHLSKEYREEVESFVALCRQNRIEVEEILLLSRHQMVTDEAVMQDIPGFKKTFPGVLFGAGTNYNFNEINKNRFISNRADFISFSVDPQEHAFDDLTIVENIEAQEHLVRSAKTIYGENMPVHVSPVSLRKRFNPYATNPADLYIGDDRKADPRQKEEFTALWTFGSICSLTRGGAHSITFFQTVGNQGILSAAGDSYPVYHCLELFAPYQGKQVDIVESSDPLSVQAILIDGHILALANLSQEKRKVRFNDLDYEVAAGEMRLKKLDGA
jgi:hypothetical protein